MKNIIPDFPQKKDFRKKIGVGNFKIFKSLQSFEIAPLTILTGPNSAGKSSFTKAIHLIAENLKNPSKNFDELEILDFQNPKIHLGSFKNVINHSSDNDTALTFQVNFFTELWGDVNAQLEFIPNNKNDFKDARLKTIILGYKNTDNDEYSSILQIERIKLEYPSDENPNNKVDYWNFYFDENLWFDRFYKLLELGEFQVKVRELYVHLWKLYEEHKEHFIDYLEGDYKVLYKKLIKEGLSPLEKKFPKSGNPYSYSSWHSSFRLNYISDGKPFGWNEVADKLYNRFKKHKTLIEFPLFNSKEWRLNFTNDGKRLNNNDEYKKELKNGRINNEDFSKIRNLLDENEIIELDDIGDIFREKEKTVLKESFNTNLKPSKYQVWGFVDGGYPSVIPGVVSGKLSDFIKQFHNVKPFKDNCKDPISLEDYSFYPLKDNRLTVRVSKLGEIIHDNSHEGEIKEDKYITSTNDLIKIVRNVVTESLNAFSKLNETIIIESQRNVSSRLHLDVINTQFNKIMRDYLQIDSYKSHISTVDSETRKEFVNKWIKEFKIADEILIKRDKEGIGTKAYLRKNTKETLIADEGYGIAKLLPIILQLAVADTNSMIIVEEPEANLHPSLQSKLADLFFHAYQQFNHHFIIETHSEYLIRKLQYLVASKDCEITSADVNIYYLYHPKKIPENKEQVEKLMINPDGSLSDDFGPGFIDEAINWKFELMKLKTLQNN